MKEELGFSSDHSVVEHVAYFDPASDAVPNHGMGICCYSFSDTMYTLHYRGGIPEVHEVDRKTFDKMAALPHCDHFYIRPEWCDIQKSSGKLDLPPIWEWTLEAAEKYKKGWSFRIMPSSPQSLHASGIPEFLKEKIKLVPYDPGANRPGPKTKYYPVYDEEYIKRWTEMLYLLADKYDKHPLLEFVDISGFGFWGEWHHGSQGRLNPQLLNRKHVESVTKKLVDNHLDAFVDTHSVIGVLPGGMDDLFSYALDRGVGMRRDSFCPDYTAWEYRMSTNVKKPGAIYAYEPGVFPDAFHSESEAPEISYNKIFQRVLDIGSSYIGLGWNPWHAIMTHEHFPDVLKRTASKVGYRLRPAIISAKRIAAREKKWLTVGLINDGVAAPSGSITLKLTLPGDIIVEKKLEPGFPDPGKLHMIDVAIPEDFSAFGDGNSCTLTASLEMGKKIFPVRWAVEASQAEDPDRKVLRIPLPYAFDRNKK